MLPAVARVIERSSRPARPDFSAIRRHGPEAHAVIHVQLLPGRATVDRSLDPSDRGAAIAPVRANDGRDAPLRSQQTFVFRELADLIEPKRPPRSNPTRASRMRRRWGGSLGTGP